MTNDVSGGRAVDVFCGACQNTHTLILSKEIPIGYPTDFEFPKEEAGGSIVALKKKDSFNRILKKQEILRSFNEGPKSVVSFDCPEKTNSQLVIVPTSGSIQPDELEVSFVINRSPNAWMSGGSVVSTALDSTKEIYLPNIISEPEKIKEFEVSELPKNGKLAQASGKDLTGTYEIKMPLMYIPFDKMGYDSFTIKKIDVKNHESFETVGIFVSGLHSFFVSPTQRQVLEFGKELIPNSITKLKDFINFVIPTITGVLATYIGLFSFFGLEKIHEMDFWIGSVYMLPVLLMIASLILFQFGMRPNLRRVYIGNISSLVSLRDNVMSDMNRWIKSGFIVFSSGLFFMALVLIPLFPAEEQDDNGFSLYENQKFHYSIKYPAYWNVTIHDQGNNVSFTQLGAPNGPNIQINSQKQPLKLKSFEFAKEKSLEFGPGSSTPIPVVIADVNSFNITWTNGTMSKMRLIVIDDITNSSHIIDYSAKTIDYGIYLPVITEMKNSMQLRHSKE